MSGHETIAQRDRIQLLETKLAADVASNDEILELALLAIEPGHGPFHAYELLKRMPCDNPLRNVWLAFVDVYELMDEHALNEAVGLCSATLQLGADASILAAAFMLRAAALRRLTQHAAARSDAEESVRLAPYWIGNRQLLAQMLLDCSDVRAAEQQLRRALDNVQPMNPPAKYADYMFELLITARIADRIGARLRRQLSDL